MSPVLVEVGATLRAQAQAALPAQVLCREGCLGLCPRCGENLNEDPAHEHPPDKDPRWSKLDELRFD